MNDHLRSRSRLLTAVASCGQLWFGLEPRVLRASYAASGLGLAVFKYVCEAILMLAVAGVWLSPLDFLNPSLLARQELLLAAPEWLGWAYFAWNLPFVWIAISMSVRRASTAGWSPWLGLFVLLPVVGLVEMLLLSLAPDRAPQAWTPNASDVDRPATGERFGMCGLRAMLAGVAVGVAMLFICIYFVESYGAALFLGTPLVMGATTGYFHNRPAAKSVTSSAVVGLLLLTTAGGIMLAFALEGAICLVMAAPIVAPLGFVGIFLGRAVARVSGQTSATTLPLFIVLPLFAGAEATVHRMPVYCVVTTVEVNAPPEDVWPFVVSFPDLDEPTEWFFRCGIACPQRARIEGSGVGAVRHCEFTTGDFVEPITAWEPPHRLAFDVTSQPDPMVELSPYRHVHPPHLADQSLKSRKGEFRLVALPNGTTRLEGRTWYTFEMHPQAYWTLWSDLAIHAIHRRVLLHIKQLAEGRDAPSES